MLLRSFSKRELILLRKEKQSKRRGLSLKLKKQLLMLLIILSNKMQRLNRA